MTKVAEVREPGELCGGIPRCQMAIRPLIYLTITRPDLSYPVGVISQCIQRPTVEHLQCAMLGGGEAVPMGLRVREREKERKLANDTK